MTDQAGSATPATADAGTPATANGGGDQGSTANTASPFADLDTGTREWVEKAGLKDVKSVVEKARNAESLIGRSVQIPGDDAKPEDVDKYILKATEKFRPKDPDGYEFKLPEGIPKEMPYDAEFAKTFKAEAHKNGLPTKQATALHDFYVNSVANVFKSSSEKATTETQEAEKRLAESAVTATQKLEMAFGGKRDSEEFKKEVELTGRAVRELGGEELLKELTEMKVLDSNGLILKPTFSIAFNLSPSNSTSMTNVYSPLWPMECMSVMLIPSSFSGSCTSTSAPGT